MKFSEPNLIKYHRSLIAATHIRPKIARRWTACHAPFRGFFSLENIFPFRGLVVVANRPLTQIVSPLFSRNGL